MNKKTEKNWKNKYKHRKKYVMIIYLNLKKQKMI